MRRWRSLIAVVAAVVVASWLWAVLLERLEATEILSRAVRRRYALTRQDVERMIETERNRED